ncbi:hypothetical protein MKX03_009669 [Papaver bracteatum]|nr:hypothetical protein MKX03_009669 [Papaver bracteatum]
MFGWFITPLSQTLTVPICSHSLVYLPRLRLPQMGYSKSRVSYIWGFHMYDFYFYVVSILMI